MAKMRVAGKMDIERRGTYNPLGARPTGVLPQTPPVVEYVTYPHLAGYKRRERRVNNFPDGASAYLFPGAYDPMVNYPGPSGRVRITHVRNVCKEVWEY